MREEQEQQQEPTQPDTDEIRPDDPASVPPDEEQDESVVPESHASRS